MLQKKTEWHEFNIIYVINYNKGNTFYKYCLYLFVIYKIFTKKVLTKSVFGYNILIELALKH